MITALCNLLSKADGIPEKRLLWINAGVAFLIVVSHGSALAITHSKPSLNDEGIRQLAMISLPLAAVMIVSATAALVRAELSRRVLAIHGIVLAAGGVAALLWAATILVRGIPKVNFSWSPGLLSVSVAYSIFLLSRFSLPTRIRARTEVIYAPVAALAVAAMIDIGVFVRLLAEMGARFGH